MPYQEQALADVTLSAGGATAPIENRLTAAQQVEANGVSSGASTITLQAGASPLAAGPWVTVGTASPIAGAAFRITGNSGARWFRLVSSGASTLSGLRFAAHD